jgi:long-chain fatty acid transport protein
MRALRSGTGTAAFLAREARGVPAGAGGTGKRLHALYFLLLLLSAPARANPADAFGFGSRAAAMGNAATAIADDGSACYYNPAGLARADDLRIDIGYQAALPRLALNGHDSGVDATHGFTAALVAPGRLFGVRFAFGAALFLPDDRLTRVRQLPYTQPQWIYYDNRTQRLLLVAALAVQIVPGLTIGGGAAFMSRTSGTVALEGTIAVTDTDAQSALQSSVHVDLVALRYPHVGIAWQATRWLTVAASYRHSFSLQVDQGFSIHGNVGNPGVPPIVTNGALDARSQSSDLFQPWQLTVGGALRLTRTLLVSVDATFARWSEFPTPASQLALALDLGPTFNPLVHLPPARSYAPPGFHDILIPRLGVEWRALERARLALDLRGGYSYEASPVPEQWGQTSYADSDKHRFSLGAGLEARLGRWLPRPLAFDLHLAATYLPPRANRKQDPLDPTGDFVAKGVVVEMGVTSRWRF